MHLCSHEGRFLPGVYFALRNELSWVEAERVRASLKLIDVERAEYSEWYTKNAERVRKHSTTQSAKSRPSQLTLADYKRELDENRTGLANAQADLRKHRGALAHKLTEDALAPEHVEFIRQVIKIHADKIEAIENVINDFVSTPGANLSTD